MKRIILFFLVFVISCNKQGEDECCKNYSIPIIHLLYTDANGNNLFNSENAHIAKNVKIYYKVDGQEKILENSTALIEKDSNYYLSIGNFSQIASMRTSYEVYIELFSDQDEKDKLKITISYLDGYTVIDKIWYNDEVVFERKTDDRQDFLVVRILTKSTLI